MKTTQDNTAAVDEKVLRYRKENPVAERWAGGYGAIRHSAETQARVFAMADSLAATNFFDVLHAADRVASAGMWLVVHMTYARNVYLDGRNLNAADFKSDPEGHTGGSLNMVPAYTGYMAANALTEKTRAWIMGQGHCVAGVDSVNLLLGNMTRSHAERYSVTEEGLTRFVRDFYSYRLGPRGKQDSPLGSHVNAYTAGGLAEGGYLGFVEIQYMHMPLPGERLVVFLSDGAFEEQRGSDWAPRWWREKDCGLVTPIMINNGRRIDQRSTLSQQGGTDWLVQHLTLNGFDPLVLDGRDPAAFVWAIWEMERRLQAAAERVRSGTDRYPVLLPYGIAVAPKGAGFYGEGTNLAHNLPLMANPHTEAKAAAHFNESARHLFVPLPSLNEAVRRFQNHEKSGRPRERDHALVQRQVRLREMPPPATRSTPQDRRDISQWTRASPMEALDTTFVAIVKANPHLRPRVGNPDEMRSNRLQRTLDTLKFRVTDPEPGIPEDVHGAVITALNEEAVASAALANKGGINLIHTYEAFGTKMQGILRQEITFTNQCKEIGRLPGWLSVPLVLTSHTWENSKNELSHQDPALVESLWGEASDTSRVLFVPDYNTAGVVLEGVYRTKGQIWALVVPKADKIADLFTPEEAAELLKVGALRLDWAGHAQAKAQLVLTALGAYQLEQVLRASGRLAEKNIPHSVVYMLEPGRFRVPRSEAERDHAVPDDLRAELYPESVSHRLFVTHTRPETLLGVLQPLYTGFGQTAALGFLGRGGTLTISGMLFVNRCTWAHILIEAAQMLNVPRETLLRDEEIAVLDGRALPESIF